MAFVQGTRNAYFIYGDPDGGKPREVEAFSCGHCQAVKLVPLGMQLGEVDARGNGIGEFCLHCMAPICVVCNREMARTRQCVPFQKRLDAAVARQDLLRAVGLERTS